MQAPVSSIMDLFDVTPVSLVPSINLFKARSLINSNIGEKQVPAELFDVAEFIKISTNADECRVKRLKDVVKLKLRTPKRLYTIKLKPAEAEIVLGQIACEIQEV